MSLFHEFRKGATGISSRGNHFIVSRTRNYKSQTVHIVEKGFERILSGKYCKDYQIVDSADVPDEYIVCRDEPKISMKSYISLGNAINHYATMTKDGDWPERTWNIWRRDRYDQLTKLEISNAWYANLKLNYLPMELYKYVRMDILVDIEWKYFASISYEYMNEMDINRLISDFKMLFTHKKYICKNTNWKYEGKIYRATYHFLFVEDTDLMLLRLKHTDLDIKVF